MSGNDSVLSSLIYRAIGEPEYWHQYSVEALVKLVTAEYRLDGPDNLAQLKLGKDLIGKLNEKETLVSAVMTVLDDARYGLLLVDHNFKAIYHNKIIQAHLEYLLDADKPSTINVQLRDQIINAVANLDDVNDSELIRLNYGDSGLANIYLRCVLQENSNTNTPQYLHHIMVSAIGSNCVQICEEVSQTYGLSEREVGIVQSAVKALASGGSTKEIAEDLFISPNTVKTHLKSIYAKSGVRSLASLVSLYLQHEVQHLTAYFGGTNLIKSVTNPSDDKMLTLSDQQQICYREYGDPLGEPLLVLHNIYSSRLNIPPDGDAIAKKTGRRVIVADRPGYGKSPASDMYPQQWNRQLAEFVEQLNLSKFDLLGNALSSRYALEFVDKYPEKVSKLLLTAPVLHTSINDKEHFCEWLAVSTELYERNPRFATEIFKLWHASASLSLDTHIQKNLGATISSAEKGIIDTVGFIQTLKNNFRESASQQGRGTAEDFRYCFNKMTIDLGNIVTKTEIWIGNEDGLCSRAGVEASLKSLTNKAFFEKEGFGEHIYYSQFENIITLRA